MTAKPLTRPVAAAAVPPGGVDVEVVADAGERESLAAMNEVESVERLVARLHVAPYGGEGLRVTGEVEADARRICGVTLEPFVETVREPVDLRFTPEGGDEGRGEGAEDPPDPLVDGGVDLGAIASEFFTLGLAPHPRKPGAELEQGAGESEASSPFASLAVFREKRGS